jgi:hypothetical protein
MEKRLFLVLSVLFIFSLLFVQVLEAGDNSLPAGTYTFTITKIGFYITDPGDDELPPDIIIDLPSSQIVRVEVGGGTPTPDFIYQGNIPNGTFEAIGVYAESSTVPGVAQVWVANPFDNGQIPVAKTFTESDRKLIKYNLMPEYQYATVENL